MTTILNSNIIQSHLVRQDLKTEQINKYIQTVAIKPFSWGHNDCFTFTRDILNILQPDKHISVDIFKHINYNSLTSAYRIQKQFSWHDYLIDNCDASIIQNINYNVGRMQEYDIILIKYNGFECMHIVINGVMHSIDRDIGLVRFPVNYLNRCPRDLYTVFRLNLNL